MQTNLLNTGEWTPSGRKINIRKIIANTITGNDEYTHKISLKFQTRLTRLFHDRRRSVAGVCLVTHDCIPGITDSVYPIYTTLDTKL